MMKVWNALDGDVKRADELSGVAQSNSFTLTGRNEFNPSLLLCLLRYRAHMGIDFTALQPSCPRWCRCHGERNDSTKNFVVNRSSPH
jgi:hypothetical protein